MGRIWSRVNIIRPMSSSLTLPYNKIITKPLKLQNFTSSNMNKFVAITIVCLVALVALVAANGYSSGGYGGHQSAGYGYSAPSYGQNYERKTGFKTVIYHPYGGVSNRFDYRTFPAYGGGYGSGYGSHPAPYIKTGLEYTIGDSGYGNQYGSSY